VKKSSTAPSKGRRNLGPVDACQAQAASGPRPESAVQCKDKSAVTEKARRIEERLQRLKPARGRSSESNRLSASKKLRRVKAAVTRSRLFLSDNFSFSTSRDGSAAKPLRTCVGNPQEVSERHAPTISASTTRLEAAASKKRRRWQRKGDGWNERDAGGR